MSVNRAYKYKATVLEVELKYKLYPSITLVIDTMDKPTVLLEVVFSERELMFTLAICYISETVQDRR